MSGHLVDRNRALHKENKPSSLVRWILILFIYNCFQIEIHSILLGKKWLFRWIVVHTYSSGSRFSEILLGHVGVSTSRKSVCQFRVFCTGQGALDPLTIWYMSKYDQTKNSIYTSRLEDNLLLTFILILCLSYVKLVSAICFCYCFAQIEISLHLFCKEVVFLWQCLWDIARFVNKEVCALQRKGFATHDWTSGKWTDSTGFCWMPLYYTYVIGNIY